MSQDIKVEMKEVFSNDGLKVKEITINGKQKRVGVFYDNDNVIVLPYIKNQHGLITKFGVMDEFNPLRKNNRAITLVTGSSTDKDDTPLDTAIRELYEETGYNVTDTKKWEYLGEVVASKITDHYHPCFAVDISDEIQELIPDFDQSEVEKNSEFKLVPLGTLKNSKDALVLAMIMKVFVKYYADAFNQKV